jgi:hypothetical protein
MLTGAGSPLDGVIAEILLSVPAISIAGETDEIQRTIIAERILPREPGTAWRLRSGAGSGLKRRDRRRRDGRSAGATHARGTQPGRVPSDG